MSSQIFEFQIWDQIFDFFIIDSVGLVEGYRIINPMYKCYLLALHNYEHSLLALHNICPLITRIQGDFIQRITHTLIFSLKVVLEWVTVFFFVFVS